MPNTRYRPGISLYQVSCHKCDHTWVVRTEKLPERCPKCHSRRWMVKVDKVEVGA